MGGEMQADAGKNPQGSAFTARTRPRGNQRKENAPDAVDQSPRQPRRVLAIVLHLLQRDRARLSEPDDERRRERAGAQPALLAAAADERLHSHARPPPHVDGADALRAVHLVPADREQVDLHVLDVDRDLPHRLRGVRVKEHLALAAQLAKDADYRFTQMRTAAANKAALDVLAKAIDDRPRLADRAEGGAEAKAAAVATAAALASAPPSARSASLGRSSIALARTSSAALLAAAVRICVNL